MVNRTVRFNDDLRRRFRHHKRRVTMCWVGLHVRHSHVVRDRELHFAPIKLLMVWNDADHFARFAVTDCGAGGAPPRPGKPVTVSAISSPAAFRVPL